MNPIQSMRSHVLRPARLDPTAEGVILNDLPTHDHCSIAAGIGRVCGDGPCESLALRSAMRLAAAEDIQLFARRSGKPRGRSDWCRRCIDGCLAGLGRYSKTDCGPTARQRKYDNAEIAKEGLLQVDEMARACFKIFDAEKQGQQNATPYSTAIRTIDAAGLLAQQSLPVTGSNLIAFKMAQLLERLRHQHKTINRATVSAAAERALKEIEIDMHDLAKAIPSAVEQTEQELREARRVLVQRG